ncbi:unnamed protein product [Prorocentrum cordatum]|uniref:Uncharacterized protein n=1 Tax=Prorocentrum cordatum TaxID=2364126 RepID=A0ABN9SVW7_9DINO|nr:unnamed protein product [Polarella glacialis]
MQGAPGRSLQNWAWLASRLSEWRDSCGGAGLHSPRQANATPHTARATPQATREARLPTAGERQGRPSGISPTEGGGEKEGDKDSSHVWTRNWRSEMNLFSRWQHHCWDEWCAKVKQLHKHKLSEIRAGPLNLRRAPLAENYATLLARGAPRAREGGPAPTEEVHADLQKLCLCNLFFVDELLPPPPTRGTSRFLAQS